MSIAKGSPNHRHAGGRLPKYTSLVELQVIIDTYFAECDPHWIDEEYYEYPLNIEGKPDYDVEPELKYRKVKTVQEPYTMAGLALRLDLSRQALMEYNATDQFGDAIKAARAKVGEYNERMLHSGRNSTGAIFNLKVNFGYREIPEDNPPPENPLIFINNVDITGSDKSS